VGVGREIAVLLTMAVLILTGGCGSDGENDPGADPSQPSTPTASATPDSKKCLAAQRSMVWIVQPRVQSLTQRVLSQSGLVPPDAAEPLRRVIVRTGRSSHKECGGDPTALIPLIDLIQSAREDGLDEPLLRRIVDAYEEWARKVGQQRLAGIVYHADPCALLRKHVSASYEIRRRAESDGVAAWVEIVLTNEWSEGIWVEHHGRLRATGVRPEWATRTYVWGGSSADNARAAAGRTSRTPVDPFPIDPAAPRLPEPILLHLFPEGDVEVLNIEGWASPDSVNTCRIDLEPAESR
jgi:hypothetical protein